MENDRRMEIMANVYTLSCMKITNPAGVRVRVYDGATNTFIYQWVIPTADWNTVLAQVGTGSGGAQTGTADVPDFTPNYGKQAGHVGVLEGSA